MNWASYFDQEPIQIQNKKENEHNDIHEKEQ